MVVGILVLSAPDANAWDGCDLSPGVPCSVQNCRKAMGDQWVREVLACDAGTTPTCRECKPGECPPNDREVKRCACTCKPATEPVQESQYFY